MADGVTTGGVLLGLAATHLVYTYVAYPLIVSLLPARPSRPAQGGRRREERAAPPSVSIVIAARDPGQAIAEKVGQLLRTVTLDSEIIAVLDGPDPGATAALAQLGDDRVKVRVLDRPCGKAVALNEGVAVARGEVLVFTDVRQRVAPGAVECLVGELAAADVGAVSGSLVIPSPDGRDGLYQRYWRFERWLRRREAAWDSAVGVSGALYALKRALWSPLPAGLLLDDVWVPFQVVRAGQRVGFAPGAVATDVQSGSDATELARKVRTLTGNYQLIAWMPWVLHPRKNRLWWQFVSHKVLRLLTPFAVVAGAAGVLLVFGPWAGVVGVAIMGLPWIVRPARSAAAPGNGFLGTARSGVAILAALLVAAFNAARGRWDVWTDPPRPTFADPPPQEP
ncbi:MAG TPA: glycosyltransferase [Gemmatimonadales bacterium]|nr:glycosyltransferase [Gemmatimonadales bacterium]